MIIYDIQTAAEARRNRLVATLNLVELALDMPRLYADQARRAVAELRADEGIDGVGHDNTLRIDHAAGCDSPAAAPPKSGRWS